MRRSIRINKGQLPAKYADFVVQQHPSSQTKMSSQDDNVDVSLSSGQLQEDTALLLEQLRAQLQAVQVELKMEKEKNLERPVSPEIAPTSFNSAMLKENLVSSRLDKVASFSRTEQNMPGTKTPFAVIDNTNLSALSPGIVGATVVCSGEAGRGISAATVSEVTGVVSGFNKFDFNSVSALGSNFMPSKPIYTSPTSYYANYQTTMPQMPLYTSQQNYGSTSTKGGVTYGVPPPAFKFESQPSSAPFPPVSFEQLCHEGTRRKLLDLPEFVGRPEDWPMFSVAFRESTAAFRYTNLENSIRLQKSLKGEARESVEALLIHPNNVEHVISQLEFRYGRPECLLKSQIEKVRKIAPFSENNMFQIVSFATKVQNLAVFVETIGKTQHLCNPILLEELVDKLPLNKRLEWAQVAYGILPYPTIKHFSQWLDQVARIVSLVVQPSEAQVTSGRGASRVFSRNQLYHVDGGSKVKALDCCICGKSHSVSECSLFLGMTIPERWEFIKKERLCFSCLKFGHGTAVCRRRRVCGKSGCRRMHHQLLHDLKFAEGLSAEKGDQSKKQMIDTEKKPLKPERHSVLNCQNDFSEAASHILFRVVPVRIFGPKEETTVYAFLDDGSSITIIDENLAKKLHLEGKPENLNLQWIGKRSIITPSKLVNFELCGIEQDSKRFRLQNVQTMPDMCLPVQSLRVEDLQKKFPHLKTLPITGYSNVKPQILIGLDYLSLTAPIKVRKFTGNGPVAVKTKLGWVAYGSILAKDEVKCNQESIVLHARQMKEECDLTEIQQLVKDYFTTENFGVKTPVKLLETGDDARARQIMEITTVRVNDRFETGLLWKDETIVLPNSKTMAVHRLHAIERKMSRDPEYASLYRENIKSYVKKGYARKLTSREDAVVSSRTWYLPHFGVVNPNKPNKLRLVFDAAATVDGISLNSALFTGPDNLQQLSEILFKFRQGSVAVCGDIKEMFHQIRIRNQDQDSQRFLWRDGDPTKSIQTYVMQAMTFGATCSPYQAQFVKNLNASEYANEFPEAAIAVIEKHYVDDYVDSFQTAAKAVEVALAVKEIHKRGGFELRNFVSNSKFVQTQLNDHDAIVHESVIDLNSSESFSDKILGMYWITSTDEFMFRLKFHKVDKDILLKTRRPTKREALSLVMSIFDPFGFLANFLVCSKILMQDVWRKGIHWDEILPDDIYERWCLWQDELSTVENFRLPRCYSPNLMSASRIEAHVFVDASEQAFAAVVYFRIVTISGDSEVVFVAGKTKCAPQKLLSVPRLELQAAVLGVRLLCSVLKSHTLTIGNFVLWSDSKSVLFWIRNDHRQLKPFISHRVAEILETTTVLNWRWVPSRSNVADDATRCQLHLKFNCQSRWVQGPEFLNDESQWPAMPTDLVTDASCAEFRQKHAVLMVHVSSSLIDLTKYSNYFRVKRIVAWALRFIENCKLRCHRPCQSIRHNELQVDELNRAEILLIRGIQQELFAEEYAALISGQAIGKSSSIYQLTPYVCPEDKIIRVGGRIDNAVSVPMMTKRPIVLPADHRLTILIVDSYHRRLHHQNQEAIVCEVRRKFWIPSLRVAVKRARARCNACKIRRALPKPPLMGQLPEDRLTPFVRPFTYTGLDYFGPYHVTIGRRKEKRWVALFTCLTVRAVHLELAGDLSADACILCIRNFVNRRGVPIRIRSDNGTNFIGADREIRAAKDFLDNPEIRNELSTRGIDWKFNCPLNPSTGGCWERLVQSIKRVLDVTLKEIAPRVETLRSLLIEAENIVNSRPLTHVPVSNEDDEPLTPNHFLLGTTNSTQTPGPEDERLFRMRKQWRLAQQLKNNFWRRWILEYLPTLTRRVKWFQRTKPIEVNDLVIICDPEVSRKQWQKGLITRVFPGKDGQVRSVEVRTSTSLLRRPVSKLAVLDVVD